MAREFITESHAQLAIKLRMAVRRDARLRAG